MFTEVILVDSYDRTPLPDGDDPEGPTRLQHALSSSGLSITLTSLCSVMAFFVGSAVDISAVSAFCVYAAWSFLANYILQFLVFVPLMVIDDRRIRKKRNFCCPCCYGHGVDELGIKGQSANSTSTKSMNISMKISSDLQCKVTANCNCGFIECADSWLSKVLLPVMTNRISRLLVIVLFLCTLSGSIYVIPSIDTGTDPKTYVPDDSMVLDFMNTLDAVWSGSTIAEQDVVIQNQDFSDIAVRDTVYELISDLESQDDALGAVTNWLDEFEIFLNETGQEMDTMDSSAFYSELQSFSNGTRWETEIIYDHPLNPKFIKMTRFKLSANAAKLYSDIWTEYESWNDIFDAHLPSNEDGFVFHTDSMPAYFQNIILKLTTNNMVFAGIGVFLVLLLFIDLRMALFLLVIVSIIDVHLMAWIWAFDIVLDGTSYIVCVMAVGLTVDYVIHITHSIAEAQPQGDISKMEHQEVYNEKLKITLNTMGVSVWYVSLRYLTTDSM